MYFSGPILSIYNPFKYKQMKKLFALCLALSLMLGISAQTVVFSEDFSLITDSTSSSIANSINSYTTTTGWTADWVYPATGKVKVGKSSAVGFLQTPALDLSACNGQFVISFDAEAWYNDSRKIKVFVDNTLYEVDGLDNDGSYGSYKHFELPLFGGTSATTIRFEGYQASKGRFFIDNIVVTSQNLGPDETAPSVVSVTPTANTLAVTFSETVDPVSAQNLANYEISDNISVTAAFLNDRVVAMALNPALVEGNFYTLVVKNVADTSNNVMSADTITFQYGLPAEFRCDNIAELRTKLDYTDNTVNHAASIEYKLCGAVVVTAIASYNNQKVLQDETGAILVFDPDGKLGTLEVGDKISGVYVTLTNYFGFLEFAPTRAYETLVGVYQDVEPMEISLSQLNDQEFMIQHQAELIKMNDVSFTSTGNFEVLNVYEISQNGTTSTAMYPYFQDANYIGSAIPTAPVSTLVGFNFATSKVGSNYPAEGFRYYIVPRSTSDFMTTSIQNYENSVAVYPNPATDLVKFDMMQEAASVVVFDINGKILINEAVRDNTLSVGELNSGIYFVRLLDAQKHQLGMAKIVKY